MYKGRTDVLKKVLEEFTIRYEEQLLGGVAVIGDDNNPDDLLHLIIEGGNYVALDIFFERDYLEQLAFSQFDEAIIGAIIDVISNANFEMFYNRKSVADEIVTEDIGFIYRIKENLELIKSLTLV